MVARFRPSGFTLIELLVIVALIAILAALLFPVFTASREQARQSACASNLSQIGKAILQYADDWDGYFSSAENTDGKLRNWKDFLFPHYLSAKDVFLCPSNPIGWGAQEDYWGRRPSSVTDPTTPLRGDDSGLYPVSYDISDSEGWKTVATIRYPSETILVGETRKGWGIVTGTFESSGEPAFRHGIVHHHNKRINFLFVDGHVKALKAIQTLTPIDFWEPELSYASPSDPLFKRNQAFIQGKIKSIAEEYR
jgi:prepilin-type processing-associated H-X9-DG protein/prepilin-type N-terminal cleavage/methylation domain-containing protein